jgi:23S rRNA G2445 N2-methylase RlmL
MGHDQHNLNNFEDYSSGRVIHGGAGATNFPVRLSNRIFELCVAHLTSKGVKGPYSVFDPFCGFAYTLTTLGFMHGSQIKQLYASDIDSNSLEFAAKNLALLTHKGIDRRISELEDLINKFGKDSHKEALASAQKLRRQTPTRIEVDCFNHDVLSQTKLPDAVRNVDIVIADLPYGRLTEWKSDDEHSSNCQVFLEKINDCLRPHAVVAVTAGKKQPIEHIGYERIRKFNTGKRKTLLLRKIT